MKKLSEWQEFLRIPPLAEELPYWEFLEPGITVLADGTLVKGLRLKGISTESFADEEVNSLALALQSVLNGIGDGIEVSFVTDIDSKPSPIFKGHEILAEAETGCDWLAHARLSNLEKGFKQGAILRYRLYAFIYLRSQSVAGHGSIFEFFRAPRAFEAVAKEELDERVEAIEKYTVALAEALEDVGIFAGEMGTSEIRSLVYEALNPKRVGERECPEENPAYRAQEFTPEELEIEPDLKFDSTRDQLVYSDLVQGYESFYLDGIHHSVVTLKALPQYTAAAFAEKFLELGFPFKIHLHLKVPFQSKELTLLQMKRRMAHSMSIGHGGRVTDLESEARLHSTEEVLRDVINTGQKIFYFQLALLVSSEDREELMKRVDLILANFRKLGGAEGLQENLAAIPCFKTLLPTGNVAMVRTKRMKSDNLADFLPLYQPDGEFSKRPVSLFRSRQKSLIGFDSFDPGLPNYNMLVTGSSGAGKSFVSNLLLLQEAVDESEIYILDIGGSYRKLAENFGGKYIELSPPVGGKALMRINPLALGGGIKRPTPRKIKFLVSLLEMIFADEDKGKLTKLERSVLEESLVDFYESFKGGEPTLSDFADFVKNIPEVKDFSKLLYPWTGDRAYGLMLDGPTNLNLRSDKVVFDFRGLSSYPELQSVMVLIVTDFILEQVEGENSSSRKKRILMDEVWAMLKSDSASRFMEYAVRTLRKFGSGVTFVTQGLDEIVESSIGGAILGCTATKLILQQQGGLDLTKTHLKLRDVDMELISSLRQVKGQFSEGYLVTPEKRGVIQIVPSPEDYWISTSDARDKELYEDVRSKKPELRACIEELARKYPGGSRGGRLGDQQNQKIWRFT